METHKTARDRTNTWQEPPRVPPLQPHFLDSEDSLANKPWSRSWNCWEQQQPCDSQAQRLEIPGQFPVQGLWRGRAPAGSSTRCDRCLTDPIVSNFLLAALTPSRRISSPSPVCYRRASPRPPPGTAGRFLEDLWKCWRSGKTTAFKSFITAGLTSLFGYCGRQLKGSAGREKKKNVAVRVSDANICTHVSLFWFIGNLSFWGQVTFFFFPHSSRRLLSKVQQIEKAPKAFCFCEQSAKAD